VGEIFTIKALVILKYPPDAIHHTVPTMYKTRGAEQEKNSIQLIISTKHVSTNIFLYPNLSATLPNIYPKIIPTRRKSNSTMDFVFSPALYTTSITMAR
jgi:hypothetical protein